MGADGLEDLVALQRAVVDRAERFAEAEDGGIAGEIDVFRARRAVDIVDDKAVVDVATFRCFIEVVARMHGDDLARDAALAAHVHLDARGVLLVIDGDEAQVCGVVRVFRLKALHLDLLDELELVAVLRVELVDEVMVFDVRRGVAENGERGQGGDGLFRLRRRIDGLRLVDDDDGARAGDELDGLAAVQPVVGAMDDVRFVFGGGVSEAATECIDVDDHDLHGVARGKRADFVELRAVVDERIVGQVVVEVREMVAGDLDGLPDALLDGEVRHDDDKFREAVGLVEIENGSQVNVRLARAGLHLNIEVHAVRQLLGGREAVFHLDAAQIFEDVCLGELEAVADALRRLVDARHGELRGDGEDVRLALLPVEQADDGSDGGLLVVEGGVKLEFHTHSARLLTPSRTRRRRALRP